MTELDEVILLSELCELDGVVPSSLSLTEVDEVVLLGEVSELDGVVR